MSRRRKVNRDAKQDEMRKAGICPKCRVHVGRGRHFHEKKCKGPHA